MNNGHYGDGRQQPRCVKTILFTFINLILVSRPQGSTLVHADNLPNCYATIESVVDEHVDLVEDCDNVSKSTGNELFRCVKKESGFEEKENDIYLTCGFSKGNVFRCDSSRIAGADSCSSQYEGEEIVDCDQYQKQEAKKGQTNNGVVEKKACYPKTHICASYNTDGSYSEYYRRDFDEKDSSVNIIGEYFYLYRKNAKPGPNGKNCNLKVFSCDFRVKNELGNRVANSKNVVFSDSTDVSNVEFTANVNAKLGNMAFFRYAGSCKYGSCGDILNKAYYYKYVNGTSTALNNDTVVFYFTKNLRLVGGTNLCHGYLPNCGDVPPADIVEAMYRNVSSNSNRDRRLSFYRAEIGKTEGVLEEYLWYINSVEGVNALCLATSDAAVDIGYCSDLNDAMDGLRYGDGLETRGDVTAGTTPNCYLKSCADLTQRELEIIASKGNKNNKYCSEYYWLATSDRGLKYFPREKPVYCSDLEMVNGAKQLKFREGLHMEEVCDEDQIDRETGNCKGPKRKVYHSYGGGLNVERNNCYLKNCFSLTEEERKVVSDARAVSVGYALEDVFGTDGSGYSVRNVRNKLPSYCDNRFLFNKNFPGYANFDPLNLNVIPCSSLPLNNVSEKWKNIPAFSELIKNNHDSRTEYRFCRAPYNPVNFATSRTNTQPLLGNVIASADEGGNEAISVDENFSSDQAMVDFTNHRISDGFEELVENGGTEDAYSFTNICSYVDNNFVYYNADIPTPKKLDLITYTKIGDALQTIKNKDQGYFNCIQGENTEDCTCSNEIYCKPTEDLFEIILGDCKQYGNGSTLESTYYFDCDLYADGANLGYAADVLEYFNSKFAGALPIIQKGCASMAPLEETRDLAIPDSLYQLAKPNKLADYGKHSSQSKTVPGEGNVERYGCTYFNRPSKDFGIYGCKLPRYDSNYIGNSLAATMYNDSALPSKVKLSNSGENKASVNVCSRYVNNIYEVDGCGQREGSLYKDSSCLRMDEESDYIQKLEDKLIPGEGIGGSRYRISRTNRDILVFRDFHTYRNCYSDYAKEGKDQKIYDSIYDKWYEIGAGMAAGPCWPIACIACMIIMAPAPCYAACIAAAGTISAKEAVKDRKPQYNLNLQNDLFIARGYLPSESTNNSTYREIDYYDRGFLSRALLVNNDNYFYIFHPRSDNIETDIKYKLENNISDSGERFYHNMTLGVDIIKKCDLTFLLGETKSIDKSSVEDFSYSLNSREKPDGELKKCTSSNAMDCLTEEQKECVLSHGVRFLGDGDFQDVDDSFVMNSGNFFQYRREGEKIQNRSSDREGWLPVDIVYYTKDTQTLEQLKNNKNCQMGVYGDPLGDLSRCRGFEIDCSKIKDQEGICKHLGVDRDYKNFFTESQSTKLPLAGSPFLFYTLMTPRNTPEMFDPSFFLKSYFRYADFYEKPDEATPYPYISNEDTIVDFFNPKFIFDYDYNGGTSSSLYKNVCESHNKYTSQIGENETYSQPYLLKYDSKIISDTEKCEENSGREYKFALLKWYSLGIHGEYIPNVKVYRIMPLSATDDKNIPLELAACETNSDVKCAPGDRFMSIDNKVANYRRAPLELDNFTLKQLTIEEIKDGGFNEPFFLHPRLEVFIGPDHNMDSEKNSTEGIYRLTQGEEKYIKDFGVSDIQSYGVNIQRSYCSKLYYDYYQYLNEIEVELQNTNDPKTINRLNKSLANIDEKIRVDCDAENGEETEILLNETEMKTFKEVGSEAAVVAMETASVKRYNESYGGFNEACIDEYDIDKIFELRKEYLMENDKMPFVLVYADSNKRQRATKCILDDGSRANAECVLANRVYVYCSSDEVNMGLSDCREYLDINTMKKVWAKSYDCILNNRVNPRLTKELSDMTADDVRMMQACFSGGFNYSGNVYRSGAATNSLERLRQCKCMVVGEDSEVASKKTYGIRAMTPREYGLCVDLNRAEVCPAVKYHNIDGSYVDDELALGKTKEELDNEGHPEYYKQHLWRTNEERYGTIPSVFYTKTLGHAEFPSSTYCEENTIDCIGGSEIVTGECKGYWKQNGNKVPKAICKKRQNRRTGTILYEYELLNAEDGCIRYSCPKIGFKEDGTKILDEREIENASSNLFSKTEANNFSNIIGTDYTSFINNEEVDVNSVDQRGAFNGFAVWRGKIGLGDSDNDYNDSSNLEDKYFVYESVGLDQRSGDFAMEVQADSCLTGFAPAGSNYKIFNLENQTADNQNNYDFYNVTDMRTPLGAIVTTYQAQNNKVFGNVINDGQRSARLPYRRCGQKGEWLASMDMYNDKDSHITLSKDNKFFFSDSNNFWFKNLWKQETPSAGNYCERLVCKEILTSNENIYTDEFLTNASRWNKTWLQSGGANWNAISSPRNSSNLIQYYEIEVAKSESSRSIANIYTKEVNNTIYLDNKYKYVKKVLGTCNNDYGYYERGTQFYGGSFGSQTEIIADNLYEKTGKNGLKETFVNIRKEDKEKGSVDWDLLDKERSVNVYRMCTSTGLWGGITNRCFRACEMLDIYQTELDNDVYNNSMNANIFVENHDIQSLDTSFNRGSTVAELDEKREARFQLLELRSRPDKTSAGFRFGDRLTGGASWERSIVSADSPREQGDVKDRYGKSKRGMRYVEVTGICDTTYATDNDNDPTQYVLNKTDNFPRRRCYEDGTWGPVIADTRCVLAKTCKDFPFYVADLAKIIRKYDEVNTLKDLNEYLADIYHSRKKNDNCPIVEAGEVEFDGCQRITIFSAPTFSLDRATSDEKVFSYSSSFNDSVKYSLKSYEKVKLENYHMVCNASSTIGDYVPGWSFGKMSLGYYFIPRICTFTVNSGSYANYSGDSLNTNFSTSTIETLGSSTAGSDETMGNLRRLAFIDTSGNMMTENGKHYTKDSLLHKVYNELDCLKRTGNNIKKGGCTYTGRKHGINDGSGNRVINDLIDDSYKTVNVDSKTTGFSYESYQVRAICDNRYFYNEIASGTNYHSKNVIFECSGKSCSGANCKFAYHNETTNSDYANYLIKAEDCKPKTCGSNDGSNDYQIGWSKSTVREVVNNGVRYNFSGSSKTSELNCDNVSTDGIPRGFVVRGITDSDGDKATFTGYQTYYSSGLVSKINIECSAFRSMDYYNSNGFNADPSQLPKQINGITVKNSYDAHRYGNLIFDSIANGNKEFCTDINKTNCYSVTEKELSEGSNFRGKYCVKMVCPKDGLKLDGDKILTQQTSGNVFSLPGDEKDYPFGTVVTIQSYSGDYAGTKYGGGGTDPAQNRRYVQYGGSDSTRIRGRICNDGDDIYNSGEPAPYSYDVYYESLADPTEKTNTSECFGKLESLEAINIESSSCATGYTAIKSGLCVQYNSNYNNNKSLADKIPNFISSMGNYRPSANLAINVAKFVVHEVIYGKKSKFLKTEDMINYLQTQETSRIEQAKEYAKTKATEDFKKSTNLFCLYDDAMTAATSDVNKYGDIALYKNNNIIYGLVSSTSSSDCSKQVPVMGTTVTCSKEVTSGTGENATTSTETNNYCIASDTNAQSYCSNLGYTSASTSASCEIRKDTVYGKKYQKIDVYNSDYDKYYSEKKTELDNAFRDSLATSIAAGNVGEFKDLFDEYYEIFKMGEFLSSGSNLEIYNEFLSSMVKVEYSVRKEDANYLADALENTYDGLNFYSFNGAEASLEDSKTSKNMFTVTPAELDDSKYYCYVSKNDESDTTENDETDANEIDESIERKSCNSQIIYDKYETYFLNFLNSDTYKTDINNYRTEFYNMKSRCDGVYESYKDYYENTYKSKLSSNKSKYRSGLFMVMKCEPTGWVVQDSPSCKKRCSGTSGKVSVDPTGIGDWDVKLKLYNLRHGKNVSVTLSAYAQTGCGMGESYSTRSDIGGTCNNGNISWSSRANYESGLDWERKEGKWYCFGLCDKCWATSNLKINGYTIRSHKHKWYKESHVIYVCPDGSGGGRKGSNFDCGGTIDNVTTMGYIIE